MAVWLPVREELRGVEAYGAPHLTLANPLNVNENPYPPPADVVDAVLAATAEALTSLNRYPDRDFLPLRQALAAYLARESGATFLTDRHLWAANGSNEVMIHLFQAFGGPGRSALSFTPTYSMYPEYARDTHTAWTVAPRQPDFSIDTDDAVAMIESTSPSLVVLASPNNPTGTALGLDQIEAVARATWKDGRATALVVVDEAYAEFRRPGVPSALDLLPTFRHLVVTRTMSKAFAFAGARLGYLAADPQVVGALTTVRLPYHLSSLTQAAALAALTHSDSLTAQVAELRLTRDRMAEALRQMINPATGEPLDVADSDANFVLFGTFPKRHAVWEGLVNRGVLIREVGPEGYLRASVGTPDQTDAFLTALPPTLNEVFS